MSDYRSDENKRSHSERYFGLCMYSGQNEICSLVVFILERRIKKYCDQTAQRQEIKHIIVLLTVFSHNIHNKGEKSRKTAHDDTDEN